MATFVLIHGAGDRGRSWRLVGAELSSHGHAVITPDLPCEDESAGLLENAAAVVDAVDGREDAVVVCHSLGGFIAPLVAEQLAARALVYLAAMVPEPGECAGDWWENTEYSAAVTAQASIDDGRTGNEDPFISFLNGVPRELAEEALRDARGQSSRSMMEPWTSVAHPRLPTRVLVCRDDRFFPAEFLRRVARDRLGITAEEVPGCHCAMLSHPVELAAALEESLR